MGTEWQPTQDEIGANYRHLVFLIEKSSTFQVLDGSVPVENQFSMKGCESFHKDIEWLFIVNTGKTAVS